MNLKDKVRQLPLTPGIYLMKDQHGNVIYVGKAKRLKLRVQTYFQNSASHPPKIKKMVANIAEFDYILTDTEFEAFMLECKLIKHYKPPFNRRMKSHHSYSYIAIKMDGPYRKISVTMDKSERLDTLYFGPYTSPIYVKQAIENLKEYFHINCLHPLKGSPCLNYSLGRCNGLCVGGEAIGQYNAIVDRFIDLLSGNDLGILEGLHQKMQQASEEFRFEDAVKFRNYSKSLSILSYKENLIKFAEENKHIAVIEKLDDTALKFFLIRGHRILFTRKFTRENVDQLSELIIAAILPYLKDPGHNEALTITKENLDEAQIMYSYLNGSDSRYIALPDKGMESGLCAKLNDQIRGLLINAGL